MLTQVSNREKRIAGVEETAVVQLQFWYLTGLSALRCVCNCTCGLRLTQ